MSTCTETTDWGPITRGSRFDVDIELPDLDDPAAAYDLTGLVARVQLRERSAAGRIILTGRSDDAEPVISIASPATGGLVQVSIPGSALTELVPHGRVHVEVDVIDPDDDPAEPQITVAGLVTVTGKSLVEEEA